MAWFHKGDQGGSESKGDRTFTFWLKVGESRKILFLEDIGTDSIGFWEHALTVDGDWQNKRRITCTSGSAPCLVCEQHFTAQGKDGKTESKKFGRYHVNVVTVMDMTPYTSKSGTTHSCTKKEIPMKHEVFEMLTGKSKIRRDNGFPAGLKGWLVNTTRISKKRGTQEVSYSVGNDFEPIRNLLGDPALDMAKEGLVDAQGNPVDLNPIDYVKVHAPPSREELVTLFANHEITDGNLFSGAARRGTEETAKTSDSTGINY